MNGSVYSIFQLITELARKLRLLLSLFCGMSFDSSPSLGKFYGIGVGPGDPELITLKGLRILQSCDVVAFPASRNQLGIAEAIATQFFQPQQQLLKLDLPFVQELDVLQQAWQQAGREIYTYLEQGQNVGFIAEGDVSFYSTFTYLMWELQAQYPQVEIQVIPGICSPLATAAAINIPLTVWADKLAILPILHNISELEAALAWAEVVVLMKVSSVYSEVWQVLRSHNLLQHSHAISWATTPKQQIWSDLSDFADLKLPYFSLLLVQRAKFRQSLLR